MSEDISLKELSELIENEIHATHSLSDSTYLMIKSKVESIEDINKPFNVRDKQIDNVMLLNPLAFKLFQFMVSTLDYVLPEANNKVIKHISNVILTKSFKFFPEYPEVFIAYAIRRIINDRNKFIHECMDDKVMNVNNKSTIVGNYIAFVFLLLIIGYIVSITNNINQQTMTQGTNKYSKYDDLKSQFKQELKDVKNKLKQKYNL